jgi:hypothetical protein
MQHTTAAALHVKIQAVLLFDVQLSTPPYIHIRSVLSSTFTLHIHICLLTVQKVYMDRGLPCEWRRDTAW